MRAVAATLLLLLLPGLLLPAGLWWHVCRCEPLPTATHACCGPDAPADAGRAACCRHRRFVDAATPAPQPGSPPQAASDDCGCVWLEVPHSPQQPSPPEPAPPLPCALAVAGPARPWRLPAPTLQAQPRAHLVATSRPPPPPHRQRNLPLRS
jgi:hypothetical protein